MFNNFDGEIFVSHAEDLEVTECGFFRLRVAINLHAEKVALVLPVKFTLKKRE